jgi:Uma2 family endonuclease
MTSALLAQNLPMTEQAYLALIETQEAVELWDGNLLVSPRPTPRHQIVLRALATALAAEHTGLHVLTSVNMRLDDDKIVIPDLVVAGAIDLDHPVVDAQSVGLICEVVSPGSAAVDWVLKRHYYAAAGIPWYLLVEQETGARHLYQLVGNHYAEHSMTPGVRFHE